MNLINKKNDPNRIFFGYRSHHFPCPNLLNVQLDSFDWLVSKKNKNSGLHELFSEFFPITSTDKQKRQLKIMFISFRLSNNVCSIADAKKYEVNHEARLYVTFQLLDVKTDEVLDETEVFITSLPLMTNKGNFIINGGEKVIVTQIVRSPAPFFSSNYNTKHGKIEYSATIIPLRGAWLEFTINKSKQCFLKIDRSRKINIITFLKALDLPNHLINDWYENTALSLDPDQEEFALARETALYQCFHKIRPGDPFSVKQAMQYVYWLMFDIKHCNLSAPGRYKMNIKLALSNRIYGFKLAEDVVDENKVVFIAKGTVIIDEHYKKFCEAIERDYLNHDVNLTTEDGGHSLKSKFIYQSIKVFNDEEVVCTLIGIDPKNTSYVQNPIDIFATLNYILHLPNGLGNTDDIDDLSNRRARTAGELIQNQIRIGLTRVERSIKERLSISETLSNSLKKIIPYLPIANALKEFFNTSQLCQYLDQTNPISELSHKRRLTALGPGGLTRDRANIDVRDVHNSYYGRICPIETPEGPNIGLINNLCCYARINNYGFIETPYFKVTDCVVSDEFEYLSAAEEVQHVIAQASSLLNKKNKILNQEVVCRVNSRNIITAPQNVEYMDVSPKQIVSVTAACIPFLEHNDSARALMGSNMQRQAVPLLETEAPLVGTGFESYIAKYSGLSAVSHKDGEVVSVTAKEIIIKSQSDAGQDRNLHYHLNNFEPSNQGSPLHQSPIVKVGQKISAGDVIADGSGIKNGEVALGRNLLVAFNIQKGFNYEDAFVISERLIKDDVYTSLHIGEHTIEFRKTRLGDEEMTREIPNVSEKAKRFLDDDGLIIPGSEVVAGDVLVGKITPKGVNMMLSAEDRLLQAIFGKKSYSVQNNSLKTPNGGEGVVLNVNVFDCSKNDNFASGVIKIAKVYIVQKRKIQEGDKMSGRHGNKGVIAKVLPVEDMPFLEDGTPVDIILNPLGVPPRMNIGQILELHLGLVAKMLNIKVATPIFEGLGDAKIEELMNQVGITDHGKFQLTDGATGEKFKDLVAVGVMYIMKLSHMVDDKLHARCTGPYSLVTQQPLGGKAQNGGQRFGEMEVWAIEAYGAANLLREMLTIKSDDIQGRLDTYSNIIEGKPVPVPRVPESFLVLLKELKALNFNLTYDEEIMLDNTTDEEDGKTNEFSKQDLL